eukprot:4563754-Karenia_brevis.AAC.1
MRKSKGLKMRKAGPAAWRQEACWTDCLINAYLNGWHLLAKSWTACILCEGFIYHDTQKDYYFMSLGFEQNATLIWKVHPIRRERHGAT